MQRNLKNISVRWLQGNIRIAKVYPIRYLEPMSFFVHKNIHIALEVSSKSILGNLRHPKWIIWVMIHLRLSNHISQLIPATNEDTLSLLRYWINGLIIIKFVTFQISCHIWLSCNYWCQCACVSNVKSRLPK